VKRVRTTAECAQKLQPDATIARTDSLWKVTQDCANHVVTTARRALTLEPAPFVTLDSTWMAIPALRVMTLAKVVLERTIVSIVSKANLSTEDADAQITANLAREQETGSVMNARTDMFKALRRAARKLIIKTEADSRFANSSTRASVTSNSHFHIMMIKQSEIVQ
jgi:hypothetical protein